MSLSTLALLACALMAQVSAAQTPAGKTSAAQARTAGAKAAKIAQAPSAAARARAQAPAPSTKAPAANTPAASGQARTLTMEDAVALALKQNRSVQQAQQAVVAAQAALAQAKAASRLTVSGSGSVLAQGPTATLDIPVGNNQVYSITIVPKTSWQATVTATQPLYHGGKLYLDRIMARLGLDRADLDREATILQITQEVRQLYLTVVQAQQLEQVAEENVSRTAEHLQDARARVEVGTAPGYDVIRAEADVANANDSLVSAKAAVDKAMGSLKTLLAINVLQPVQLKAPGPEVYIDVNEADAIKAALRHRPELAAAAKAVQLAKASVRLADSADNPSFDLFAQYQKTSIASFSGFNWGWTLGVQATKLIFDGGLTSSAVKKAEANLHTAEIAEKQAQEGVALAVYQACVGLREARDKITAAEKGVAEAAEAMRIADLRYREGVSTPVEVTDARTTLISARANLVNARFAYQQAKADLEYAIGMPLDQYLKGGPEPEAPSLRDDSSSSRGAAQGAKAAAGGSSRAATAAKSPTLASAASPAAPAAKASAAAATPAATTTAKTAPAETARPASRAGKS